MGKNRRRTFCVEDTFHGKTIEVDSQEEVEFTKWICRAVELGIIQNFTYQPKSFVLSDAQHYTDMNGKTRFLFREHVYTADFLIEFDAVKFSDLAKEFKKYDGVKSNPQSGKYLYYLDVKGGFQKDSGRAFSMNQKWMYEKYHIYVHKVVPKEFFKKFGIIEEFKFTEKTKKPSKKYLGYPMVEEVFCKKEG